MSGVALPVEEAGEEGAVELVAERLDADRLEVAARLEVSGERRCP